MSDLFQIATQALRTGMRVCVDCGAKYPVTADTPPDSECCETCLSRRMRLVEQLVSRFHLVPKETPEPPAGEQQPGAAAAPGTNKCADCGKAYTPNRTGLALQTCCEECHMRRVDLVTHIADRSFTGWRSRRMRKRFYRSPKLWIPLFLALFLSGVVIAAWRPAKKVYHQWREKKHYTRSITYFDKGDYKRAFIDARSALFFNSDNREAIRIVARSLEALRSPMAIEWRATLGRLSPEDVENSIAWAAASLNAGDYPTADRLLSSIPTKDRGIALFHHLSAAVAMNKRDPVKAEYHWAEAAKLNPAEDVYKLNMAAARLRLGSALERASALELLNELRLKSSERLPAMRALVSDALRHLETDRAKEIAKALSEDPDATFADKLLRLSTLRVLGDTDYLFWRARLEAEAVSRPDYAYELIIWMNRNNCAKEVPALLPRIPAEIASQPPVDIAIADSYAVAENWDKLQATLEASKWLHMEYVRFATLAWAFEKKGDVTAATANWKQALSAAGEAGDRVETLAKAALAWGWELRAEEALWNLTSGAHCPTWALQTLWARSLKRSDTTRLHKLSKLMLNTKPKDVTTRNNYIFLSLLLRLNEGSPHAAAEALWKENPTNPAVVSTYALSRFQIGSPRLGAQAMEKLKPEQLREPSIAVYYGHLLIASKRGAKAAEFLKLSAGWPLLPEEKTLFERMLRTGDLPETKSEP